MKKNIAIILLSLISLSSLTFGYYQKALADEARGMAEANAQLARQAEAKAHEQMLRADEQRHVAEQNLKLALEQAQIATELANAKKK